MICFTSSSSMGLRLSKMSTLSFMSAGGVKSTVMGVPVWPKNPAGVTEKRYFLPESK